MAKRTIVQMIEELYEEQEVKDYILADVKERGTEEKILAGELVLPHPSDALKAMVREQGHKDVPTDPHAKDQLIGDLSRRLATLEQQQGAK